LRAADIDGDRRDERGERDADRDTERDEYGE
jgi:hypothetical protein